MTPAQSSNRPGPSSGPGGGDDDNDDGGGGSDATGAGDAAFLRPNDELVSFLHAHRVFLDAVVNDQRWVGKSDKARLTAAWAEARTRVPDAAAALANLSETVLADSGLTGAQLDLKLMSWRRELHPVGRRLRRGWVRRTLQHANVIIGSLAGVVGLAEPLKEFGEVLGNLIERRVEQT